jgi:hypothetical protein
MWTIQVCHFIHTPKIGPMTASITPGFFSLQVIERALEVWGLT